MDIWPNFFIVGAPRAGSTSLYEYLKETKRVFMSPVKEPYYFAPSVNPEVNLLRPINDKKKYLELFKNVTDEKAIGEATTSYLWDPQAPNLIHETIPNAKIIILLRDPIERAFSHYLKQISSGSETGTFSDSIKKALNAKPDYSGLIIETGFYYEQVKRYFKIFGKENIKIIIFEEFIKNTKSQFQEILDFLQVDSKAPDNLGNIYNPSKQTRGKFSEVIIRNKFLRKIGKNILPRSFGTTLKTVFGKDAPKPSISEPDRKFLQEIYFEDVKKLEKLLNRKLPWLIFQDA